MRKSKGSARSCKDAERQTSASGMSATDARCNDAGAEQRACESYQTQGRGAGGNGKSHHSEMAISWICPGGERAMSASVCRLLPLAFQTDTQRPNEYGRAVSGPKSRHAGAAVSSSAEPRTQKALDKGVKADSHSGARETRGAALRCGCTEAHNSARGVGVLKREDSRRSREGQGERRAGGGDEERRGVITRGERRARKCMSMARTKHKAGRKRVEREKRCQRN